MHPIRLAALHQLGIPLRIRRDDNDWRRCKSALNGVSSDCPRTFSLKSVIDIAEHLHDIWPATLVLGVEEDVPVARNIAVDDIEEDRTKGIFQVGANPDQEPVIELHAGRQHRTDAGPGADADPTAEKVREKRETRELGPASVTYSLNVIRWHSPSAPACTGSLVDPRRACASSRPARPRSCSGRRFRCPRI